MLFRSAKAIEARKRGFLSRYLSVVNAAEKPAALADEMASDVHWSADTLNEQAGHFNQMIGAILGIEMANVYLGYYDKYGALTPEGSVSSRLSPEEWTKALRHGARKALEIGMGVGGFTTILDAIGKSDNRPHWAANFAPAGIDIAKAKKELQKLETDFFNGKGFKG